MSLNTLVIVPWYSHRSPVNLTMASIKFDISLYLVSPFILKDVQPLSASKINDKSSVQTYFTLFCAYVSSAFSSHVSAIFCAVSSSLQSHSLINNRLLFWEIATFAQLSQGGICRLKGGGSRKHCKRNRSKMIAVRQKTE